MLEAPPIPWVKLRHLEEQKEKTKKFLYPVSALTSFLIFDYFYIQPSIDSVFSEKSLGLLIVLSLLATTYGVYLYFNCELDIQKVKNNDLATAQKNRNLEKSKELLRKAGVFSLPKHAKSAIHDIYKPAYPYQRLPDPPVESFPKLNLKLPQFETASDLTEEFLKTLGVEKNMKRWIQNIRLWYSKQFLPIILENYSSNITNLNLILREYTQNRDRPWIYAGTFEDEGLQITYEDSLYYQRVSLKEIQDLAVELGCNYTQDLEKTRQFSLRGQNPKETQDATGRVNFVETLKQRMTFEKYLDVPGFSCHGYVLQRIRTLAKSSCLSAYTSKSGGFYNSDSWTPKRPTDSHILSHLFLCLLNNGNNRSLNPNFSILNEIVINYPNTIPYSDQPNRVWFYQKNPESCIELHFDIVSGNEMWKCVKGNENLFCAIGLFLYHVKTKGSGMFMQMNCAELIELLA